MSDNEVFDEYGNYKFPDYDNSKYINNARGDTGVTIEEVIGGTTTPKNSKYSINKCKAESE